MTNYRQISLLIFLVGISLCAQDINWADAEYNRGKELYAKEDYDSAELAFKNALQVYREKSDQKWELYTLEYLAKLYNKAGRYDDAIATNLQCLDLATSTNDMNGIGLANNRLGIVYVNKADKEREAKQIESSMGFYEKAAAHYLAALAQSRLAGKKDDLKIDLQNLIDTYQRMGRFEEASKYEAEKNQLDGLTGLAAMTIADADQLKKSGELKMKEGKYAGAIEDLQQALMFYRSKNDEQYLKLTTENLSRCYYYTGQYDQAVKLANEALHFAQKSNDHYGQGVDYNTIGMCLFYMGKPSEALTSFSTAYSFNSMDGSSKGELKTTAYFLAKIHTSLGDLSAAAPYEQLYNQLTAQGY